MKKVLDLNSTIIRDVSSYISRSTEVGLPLEVMEKTKHHILDTLAAIVSGSKLKPGQVAIMYANNQAGVHEAQVIGSQILTSAVNAALANGIIAHADETDDIHVKSRNHPGCAIVPAALSMSEREGVDGMVFLKGVVVGYDIGCRITQALGVDNLWQRSSSISSIGGSFGAAAAAAAILHLEGDLVRYVLSYTAQQASGLSYLLRDDEHIEKAFVFGGMPARNGVTAATLVQSGFTGVRDPFSGEHNFFKAFSSNSDPALLTEKLGSYYEIMFASLKKFPVGAPIQAHLQAFSTLMERYRLTSTNVRSIVVRLPGDFARIVNNRNMPDINLQYILAVTLLDGNLTFGSAHSFERMKDPLVLEIEKCITLVEDPKLEVNDAEIKRQAIVEVTTKEGAKVREHVARVRGMVGNLMTREEVERKCKDLVAPVLGEDRSQELIDNIWNLEKVRNVRELRSLLST